MKSLKGSGVRSGSGVNKAASAWAGDIRRAAKRMGVNVTSGDVGNIISLIQHESGGNAGITQSSSLRDINVLQGNPAKGLLQYIHKHLDIMLLEVTTIYIVVTISY